MLEEADCIVAHNIFDFDYPAIKKIFPLFNPKKMIDTMVLARLVYPDVKGLDFAMRRKGLLPDEFFKKGLAGTHKLEAYGYRFRERKGTFYETTDWQEWSPEMSDYCEQDVTVLIKLFEKVMSKNPSPEAMRIEMKTQEIICRQHYHGIRFNIKEAEKLYLKILNERETLRKELTTLFPPFYKAGLKFIPKRDCRKRGGEWVGYVAGAECQKIKLAEFNPASNQHIYKMLMKKYNWKPVDFTPTGEPKVTDEILESLEYPEAKPLARFLMLNKRCSQIAEGRQAWLKKVDEETSLIHGAINTMGAITRRMSHFNPNLAQVPAVYSPYGPECRGLFSPVKSGWVQVGIDADGLEACCQAHYLAPYDGGKFIRTILEGDKKKGTDLHSLNSKTLSLTRDDAKTWYYAWLYGAGNKKLGAIAKKSSTYGAKMKGMFLAANPAMKQLIEDVQNKAKEKGYLLSLDKHPIKVRSLHSALNTLFQSAGAIVMKKALGLFDDMLQNPNARMDAGEVKFRGRYVPG
jgi:DNA polymerase I-like protein with 3'-5' exonuclease and polymerase domains